MPIRWEGLTCFLLYRGEAIGNLMDDGSGGFRSGRAAARRKASHNGGERGGGPEDARHNIFSRFWGLC